MKRTKWFISKSLFYRFMWWHTSNIHQKLHNSFQGNALMVGFFNKAINYYSILVNEKVWWKILLKFIWRKGSPHSLKEHLLLEFFEVNSATTFHRVGHISRISYLRYNTFNSSGKRTKLSFVSCTTTSYFIKNLENGKTFSGAVMWVSYISKKLSEDKNCGTSTFIISFQ